MNFNLNECVSFITNKNSKIVSEIFAKWLVPYNITRIQWVALYFIHENSEISQRELSKLMNVNDSSGMRLIERLERDELLLRTRSDADRRVIFLKLTKKGEDLIISLLPLATEFSELLLNDIPKEDIKTFNNVLDKMLKNALNDDKSK